MVNFEDKKIKYPTQENKKSEILMKKKQENNYQSRQFYHFCIDAKMKAKDKEIKENRKQD